MNSGRCERAVMLRQMVDRRFAQAHNRAVCRGGFEHSRDMEGVAWMKFARWRVSTVVVQFTGNTTFVERIIEKRAADHAVFGCVLMVEFRRRDAVIFSLVLGKKRKHLGQKRVSAGLAIFVRFVAVEDFAIPFDPELTPDIEWPERNDAAFLGEPVEAGFDVAGVHDVSPGLRHP